MANVAARNPAHSGAPDPALSATLILPTAPQARLLLGAFTCLAALATRCISSLSLFPGWELDPLTIPYTPHGIGPAGSLMLDAAAIGGAALMLSAVRWSRGLSAEAAVLALGCVPLAWHICFNPAANHHDTRIGAAWLSGLFCALAFSRCAGLPAVRALVVGTLIGLAALMTLKGLVQVLYENPQTIADFRANREQYLAAQGFSADSPMGRAYIRRVESNDPTVWMGLTNVFATFAAMGVALAVPLVLPHLRRARPGAVAAFCACAAVLCAVGVGLAGSKGGYAVAFMGIGLAVAATWGRLPARLARVVGPALVAAALAAVVLRGMVGERLGELSLLFRWFYMKAAVVIGAANPLGVGPDGFKDAYLLVKDPLSPEEVASPHSLLLDWWACLGWCGIVLACLWLWWLVRASRRLAAPRPDDGPPSAAARTDHERTLLWNAAAIAIAATILALQSERFALAPEQAAVRIGGLLLWIVLGGAATLACLRLPAAVSRAALAAAAVVACVHCQIEMSGTWVQSCALVLIALGAAAGEDSAIRPPSSHHGVLAWARDLLFGVVQMALLALMLLGTRATTRAEDIAVALRPVAEVAQDLRSDRESIRTAAAANVPALAGQWRTSHWFPSPTDTSGTLARLQALAAREASDALQDLAEPGHRGASVLLREAARLEVAAAAAQVQAGRSHADLLPRRPRSASPGTGGSSQAPLPTAVALAQARIDPSSGFRPRAEAFSWLATVHAAAAELVGPGQEASGHLRAAAEALRGAMRLDPTNPLHVHRLLVLEERLGEAPDTLRLTAALLIRLDDNQRLDRDVRGLAPGERARVELLAR